ncbi:TetR/AcrR family transcriptional regulator [Brevibacterium sp. XM4083]|uniref:TetR/AcrR family transcriptional regulator n=1 Tax=Brevibacterium sp. XM4083 TaxID=2583238 RepID=UPI001125DFB8|nr:TetR/AcrR family transcriptional regulator [Brevibacterium sp. XM4083]
MFDIIVKFFDRDPLRRSGRIVASSDRAGVGTSEKRTRWSVGRTRRDTQRERTRAALVSAAQRMLADGRTAASVQEVTRMADVGHGSFYNHFATKDALFTAAIEEALEDWARLRDAAVGGIDDPALAFATSFRMTGRLQRRHPDLVRVLLSAGASILVSERGLRADAKADIARGIDSGQFSIPDAESGLMLTGGILLGLLQMLDADPRSDAEAAADEMAQRALMALGVTEVEASEMARSALPPFPDLVVSHN